LRSNPEQLKNANYYDWAYGAYEDSQSMDSHLRPVWEKALDFAEGTICELGCGAGQLARLALDRGLEYIIGVDFSIEALKIARRRCPDTTFYHEDIRDIVPDFFGTVMLIEVLEHIENDLDIMNRLFPNQLVVFSVPNLLCQGHVRAFDSLDDVLERYDMILPGDTAEITKGNKTWWIVKGVRFSSGTPKQESPSSSPSWSD